MLPLINWCFPVVSLLERIRSFPLQLFFVQLVNVIFIPISICVILLRRACGWEVPPKLYCRAKKNEWNTVALAGTQPLQNGKLPQVWDDKNRQEQDYVASYIRRQLLSLGIRSTESGPYPAYAGALSHLKTDFHFSLKDNKNLGDLLKVLHPTPAVCGLPKEEAYRFILENEGYDRKYYSGFIGWLDPEGRTDLYVNLRCMHIEDEQLTLYAGGGLLASSELNDEWQETEKKLQTMRRILVSAPIMMNH